MALVFHASYKNNIFLSAGERVIEIINQHRQTVNSPMTRGNIKLKSQINNSGLFRGSISTIEQRHAPQSSLRLITHKPESLNKHWAPAATHTHTHTHTHTGWEELRLCVWHQKTSIYLWLHWVWENMTSYTCEWVFSKAKNINKTEENAVWNEQMSASEDIQTSGVHIKQGWNKGIKMMGLKLRIVPK